MRKTLFLALMLALTALPCSGAKAQEPATYKLELTPAQVQVVGSALMKQPYGEVAPLVAELQKQVQAQQKPQVSDSREPTK